MNCLSVEFEVGAIGFVRCREFLNISSQAHSERTHLKALAADFRRAGALCFEQREAFEG
jgi:hypothetical protein